MRFSFNIDPQPRREPLDKPHYNFGFTMIGTEPYRYAQMTYTNPRRRPPQTVDAHRVAERHRRRDALSRARDRFLVG